MIHVGRTGFFAVAFASLIGAGCAPATAPAPFETVATPQEIASAQAALVGTWGCDQTIGPTYTMSLRQDSSGKIFAENVTVNADDGPMNMAFELGITWQAELKDGKPSRFITEFDRDDVTLIRLIAADGVDYAKFSETREVFTSGVAEKLQGLRTSEILFFDENRLTTKTPTAKSDCTRVRDN